MSEDAKSYNRQKHTKHSALGTLHKVGGLYALPTKPNSYNITLPNPKTKDVYKAS
jgi:hypothetical protein